MIINSLEDDTYSSILILIHFTSGTKRGWKGAWLTNCPSLPGSERCPECPFGAKTGTAQANQDRWLPIMTLAFLKVHATGQRAGRRRFHALSAGEFSQKPSGLKPFVLVSLLCPCIAKGKPDILNMKIFHILQGTLLLPEIGRFGS